VSIDTEELSDSVAQSLFSARHWYSGQSQRSTAGPAAALQ
jgi:hypothetical protein